MRVGGTPEGILSGVLVRRFVGLMVFVMTVHIYDLTGSAMNVGLFTGLTFLPRLFSPYYGSLSDRYPRGRVFSVAAVGIALGVEKVLVGAGGLALLTLAVLERRDASPLAEA